MKEKKEVFGKLNNKLEIIKGELGNKEISNEQIKIIKKEIVDLKGNILNISFLDNNDKILIENIINNILIKDDFDLKEWEKLEKRFEDLQERESQMTNSDLEILETRIGTKVDLEGLKSQVISNNDIIEKEKQKQIEKVKAKINDFFSKIPIFGGFLGDKTWELFEKKFVKKERLGFFDWIVWGILGLFLGSELTGFSNFFENLNNGKLSVSSISTQADGLIDGIKSNLQYEDEEKNKDRLEKFISSFELLIKKLSKDYCGVELNDAQIKNIMGNLNIKDKLKDNVGNWQKFYEAWQTKDNPERLNLIEMIGDSLTLPFEILFEVIDSLKIEGISIDYSKIGFNFVSGVFNYGLKGVSLLGSGLSMIFGKISMDELPNVLTKIMEKSPDTAKEVMANLVYRTGGPVINAMAILGSYATKCVLRPLVDSKTDLNSLKTIKDSLKGNFDANLKLLKDLQKNIPNYSNISHLNEVVKNLEIFDITVNNLDNANKSIKVFKSIDSSVVDFPNEFNTQYKKMFGVTPPDEYIELAKKAKDKLGFQRLLSEKVSSLGTALDEGVKSRKASLGSVFKGNHSANYVLDDLANSFKKSSNFMHSVIKEDTIFSRIFQQFNKLGLAKSSIGLIESTERMTFRFGDVNTFKEFAENLRILGKQSPNLIKFLIGKSPIFLVAGLSLNDGDNIQEDIINIGKSLFGLVPIVGPISLIKDGAFAEDVNIAQMSIGGGLLLYDGVFLLKDIVKGNFKAAGGRIIRPFVDVVEIAGKGYAGGLNFYKFTKDGFKLINNVNFSATLSNQLRPKILELLKNKNIYAKAGIIAGLILAGYFTYDYIINQFDGPDKQQIADLLEKYKDNVESLDKYLSNPDNWNQFDDPTKCEIIKYGFAGKLGLMDQESISKLEVNYDKDKKKYTVQVPIIYGKDFLDSNLLQIKEFIDVAEGIEKGILIEVKIPSMVAYQYKKQLKSEYKTQIEFKNYSDQKIDELINEHFEAMGWLVA